MNETSITLDRIDQKILAHLQTNARATNLELAQVVQLSPAQCHRRHKRLEELGLIRAYEARLERDSLYSCIHGAQPCPRAGAISGACAPAG